MKRLAWMGMALAFACGGDDGKPATGGSTDAGVVSRDGGGGSAPVTGGMKQDGGGVDEERGDGGLVSTGGDAGIGDAISDLTQAQRENLCQATVTRFFAEVTLEDECTLDGAFDTGDAAECREYVAECVDDRRASQESSVRAGVQECVDSLRGCDATVEQFEHCANEVSAAWIQIVRAFPCSEAGRHAASEEPEPKLSEACQKLSDECGSF